MTAISAASGFGVYSAPRQFAQDQLDWQIGAGLVDQSDRSALTSALDSIDAGLASAFLQSDSPPAGVDAIGSKIDEIITEQLQSGKLTQDQADELWQVVSGHNQTDQVDSVDPTAAEVAANSSTEAAAPNSVQTINDFLKQVQSTENPGRYMSDALFLHGSYDPLLVDKTA